MGTAVCGLSDEEVEVNYNEETDEWTFDSSDGKEVTVQVTVPGIPVDWPAERVASWVYSRLGHPVDSGYEAFVRTKALSETPHGAVNPERDGNGCMIYTQPAEAGR